jgi:hypothetical protein
MKHMLFLMAARATSIDCEWAKMYKQLFPRMCRYDERIKDYRGKLKVLGRIAGQMASMIFALLKTDYSPSRTRALRASGMSIILLLGMQVGKDGWAPCISASSPMSLGSIIVQRVSHLATVIF